VDVYIIRLPRFGTKTPQILQKVVDSIPVDKLDLIHVSHEYGLYQNLESSFYGSLKNLGLPIVTTMHAVGNFNIDPIVSSASAKVIVHNEFCKRAFGMPCTVIPHGCSPRKCVPSEEAKESYGLLPEWKIVGYLGFISSYKGLETLIEAMEKLPKVGLLMGGGWHTDAETAYINNLKRRTLEVLPARCQWLGYIPDEDLPRTYGAMDIVVYPSKYSTESGALLTALSYGKAVIASRVAPFREKEKLGALITFRSVTDLRNKIRKVLRDEELRRKLEEGATKYSNDNSWDRVADMHLKLYEEMLYEAW